MLQTIVNHAGTIIVMLILIGIISAAVVTLIRDKKQGRSTCGSNCGCCPMAGSCHK